MAGPGANPYNSQRHADVLNVEPIDDAAKLRLVEEVKARAKGAFSQKDMPSAEALYGKAITLLESVNGKAEAALYSNRSMVRLNLNKVQDALSDANKCAEVDPTFVKAYYRKTLALTRLNEWDEAIKAAKIGQGLEPDNKAFAEAIEKAEKDKAEDVIEKMKLRSDAQDPTIQLHNMSTARQPAPAPKQAKAEGDEDVSMRGYKTRSDGKKTSYFHTDISDEAKALIEAQGFGKPKKMDVSEVEEKAAKGGGSSWNQAGTYEEKSMVRWVEERLRATLAGLAFELPAGGKLSTTGVSDIKGEANISVSRGKRRHLLDYAFAVDVAVEVEGNSGTGKLLYTEVSADDDAEVALEMDGATTPGLRELLKAFAEPAGVGLQPLVTEKLKELIKEYKAL